MALVLKSLCAGYFFYQSSIIYAYYVGLTYNDQLLINACMRDIIDIARRLFSKRGSDVGIDIIIIECVLLVTVH